MYRIYNGSLLMEREGVAIAKEQIKIVVDADACPVKNEIIQIGRSFGAEVVMVASIAHRLQDEEGVTAVQVDDARESADLYIANRIARNNVLVTQDFGLATIGLAKGAIVLSNRGQEYTNETIGFLLERRHRLAKQRRGGKHGKGPKPFTADDRANFQQTLTKVLTRLQENFVH